MHCTLRYSRHGLSWRRSLRQVMAQRSKATHSKETHNQAMVGTAHDVLGTADNKDKVLCQLLQIDYFYIKSQITGKCSMFRL